MECGRANEKDAAGEGEKKRAGLYYIATISSRHSSPFSLSLFTLSICTSTGLWAMVCLGFLSISCSTAPMRGVHDFVSRKTGCVYREMNEVSPQGAESQEFLPPGSTANNLQNYAHKYSHISSLKILRNTHLSIACQDFREHLHTWCFCIKRNELEI